MGIEGTYTLECDDPNTRGRPCWVQKVRGGKDLFVFAQACKPDEKSFPSVETMLMQGTAKALSEYGKKKVLARLVHVDGQEVIEWLDGTGVTWVKSPRP